MKAAIPLRFEKHLEVDPDDLIVPHREEDEKGDLYTVMNVVQENLLKGVLQHNIQIIHQQKTGTKI